MHSAIVVNMMYEDINSSLHVTTNAIDHYEVAWIESQHQSTHAI